MLFRPDATENPYALRAMLAELGIEADRLRHAAIAVRHGEAANALSLTAAYEARDTIDTLRGEIERALGRMQAGDAEFGGLLQADMAALSLLESVTRSAEIIEDAAPEPLAAPRHIAHRIADDVPLVAIANTAS